MKFNKVLSFVTLIFFFFTIIGNLIPVEAYAETLNPFNVSTTINGKPLDNLGTLNITNGDSLSLKFDISPSYNIPVKTGDEITIQLPEIFKNLNVNTSNINKFFEVIKHGNELILKAKQDATKMLNAFITIGAKVKTDNDNTTVKAPIHINGASHTINIHVEKPYEPTTPTTGDGGTTDGGGNTPIQHIVKTVNGNSNIIIPSVSSSNNVLNYEIELNTQDMNGNIELTDKLPQGLELIPNSIDLVYIQNGIHDITNEIGKTIHLNSDNNKIVMSGFKPDMTYYLDYSAKIPLEFADNYSNYTISNTAYLNSYKSTANVTINTIPPKITPQQQKNMIHKWSDKNTFSKIGENIRYGISINPSCNRLINAKLIDKLPEGIELDPDISYLMNYSVVNGAGQIASYKLNIYEIFKDGSVKTIQSFKNPQGTLYYNLQKNSIEANLYDNSDSFLFFYNTKITKLKASITNDAIFTYNDMKSSSEVTSTYTSDSGAIEAWKTVSKPTLTEGENPNVQYKINVEATGFYPKNYITIKDPLEKGIILNSVEVPEGFTYKVEGNTVIITNSGTEFIAGQSAVIKLNCSLANFKDGTTIYNQANVNGYNTNKVSTKKGYAFTAIKEDAENNNQKLAGAVYGVYSATNNKLLYDVTSNANGALTGQIKEPGDYYLKEIKAPKGYELSKDKIQFKITKEDIGTTINLGSIYDNELTSKITVKKVSEETGEALKGAEFTITNSNGKVIDTITTGENGIASSNLYPGTYTIKEVKAPIGYVNSNYTKTFTVAFGGENNQEFTVKDSEILGSLLITKTGLNGVKLNGAHFKITGPNGFNKIVTTGEKGVANLNDLQWGTYNITEIKAPIGYKLDNKSKTVVINSQNIEEIQNIIFNDNQILGELNIIKTGKDGVKLEGAEFTITGPNGFNKVVTTGEDGVASLNNIPWGTYTVKETKAPQGYNLNNEIKTIQITSASVGQTQSLSFNDTQILGSLNITKTGKNGVKLEGAEFTITGPSEFNKVVTTGKNGVASLNNLQWGVYKIKETKAPLGYTLSNKTQSITINSSDVSQVQGLTFNDTQLLGNLNITKTGKDGAKLEGAEFTITGPNGFKEIVTTGENGVASLNNLPWGTYTVKETKAPQGYSLNNKVQTVQVTSASVGQVQDLTFNDSQVLGKLNITKIGNNNVKLEGAEFNISGPNGFNKVVTTGKDGVSTLENLQWGTYKIKEVKAPIGYKIDPETKVINIDKNNVTSIQNITVVDGQELGSLTITKEGLNKEKLSGATFKVIGPNGFNTEVTTGTNGEISLNGLAWGTYKVQEVKAPQGYELNNKVQTVDINSENVKSMQNLTFTDTRLNGSIKVTKLGNDGKKLAGAEFTITGDNNFNKVITTDINGVATLNNLPWGTYTVKETKAPLGYKLSDKTQSVTINSDDVSQVQGLTFNDTQILGQLNIVKTGKDGVKLEGAEFTVTGPNGFKEIVITGENGIASLNNLSWGVYTVKETKAPQGYSLNNEIQTVQVTSASVGQKQELIFNDTQILGQLNITKTGKNGVKLEGAEFTITGPSGFNKVVTTGKNGVASLNNLQWGTYEIKEVKAPIGYKIDPETKVINIDKNNVTSTQNITVVDGQELGSLTITKEGLNKEKLSGATFKVTGPNGFNTEVTTGTNGEISLNGLAWGTYKVQEVKAPKGYELNNKVQTVDINSENVKSMQNLTFTDARLNGSIKVTKLGNDGKKLVGAEFTVTGANNFKKVITTDINGVATLNNFSWGTYTVKESKAPLGYKLSDKTQSVTINSSDVLQVQGLTFNDTQILGNLNIVKTGKDGVKLEGAEFTITGSNGFNKVVTTEENGVASLNNLPWGTYTVKETKAPQGYSLNNKVQTVQVTSASVGQIQELIFNDTQILGQLSITKIGKDGVKLEGAQFNVSGPSGFNKTVTTDKNGVASLENLQWGTYIIKEIKAPQGYKLNSEVKTVKINSTDVETLQKLTIVDRQELGSLTITKEGLNKEKLAGATFKVTGPNEFNREVTTGTNGEISLNGLAWGTYKVQEVKAPKGYELNNKVQTVDINSENVKSMQNLTFTDIRLNGSIKVTKLGKDGMKLAGAEFTVTGENNFKEVITTDINGVATLKNIPWGTYTVKETKAPLGYKISDKTQNVTINSSDVSQVQGLTFNDTQILGHLNIVKTGKDGIKLEGAEFTVNGPNGFNKVVTTGENGVASLNNLPWGTYTVKETKAPQGYSLNNKVQTVQVTSASVGQVQDLTFNDIQILGELNIVKTGKDGVKLEGAQFNVSGPNGFNKVVTTGENGVATLNNIPWGTYTVKETKAPLGYKLSDKTQNVTINSSDVSEVQGLTFNDTQILGHLNIIKTGKDGVKLEGAEFTITGPNGFKEIVTTGENGVASLNNIPWGVYTVKETKAPQGYSLNNETQTVQVTSASVGQVQELTFNDTQILGQLNITKLGKNNVKLEGAQFTVSGPNGFNKVVTTGKDGVSTLENLQWGTYKIKEVKAPIGYKIDPEIKVINIDKNNVTSIQNITVVDGQELGSLTITKEGLNKEKLAGATFKVTGPNEFNTEVTTGTNGEISLNGLAWGTYKIQEVKAPQGYELNNKVQTVDINSENVKSMQNLTFTDIRLNGSIKVTKLGKDGMKLAGAEFTVTGENNFKEVITTDINGVATLKNIPWGTYTVKETKAPLGYKLSDKTQSVTINSSDVSQVQGLTFNDTQILGQLNIVKTGKDGVKLEGAEFTVTGPNGFNKVVTTEENGVASLNNLPWGTYTVKETKAPQGYSLNNEIQTVQVTSASVGQKQELIFNDTQILGQLNITKIGKNNIKLEGAEFNISGPNGFNKVVTTGENGVASLNNLQWGTYKIKETRAPQGYSLNSKTYEVKIDSDNANVKQNIVIVDGQLTGNIKITKEGVNKEKLSGATFEVTGPNGFNRAITTGKDGSVNLSGLAWGKYTIKEIVAPQGYSINKTPQVIDINSGDVSKVQNIIFTDNKILGQIDIIKTNMDGTKKLSGAEFTITGPNGFEKIVITNGQGTVSLKNLEWGTYTVKETRAPQGYNLSNKVQSITINSKNVKVVEYLTFKDSLIVENNEDNNSNKSQSYKNILNKDKNNKNSSNKENNKNSNSNGNNSNESPKTGDESELPIVLILFGAVVSLLVINRKKLKNKIEL